MNKLKATLAVIVLLLIGCSKLSAQVNTFQIWLDYDHQKSMKNNWRFFSDYGLRWQSLKTGGDWYRIHARPSVGYRRSVLMDYRGGVGFFYTRYLETANQFEIRPWQGVMVNWPNFGRYRFYQYARTEQRFSRQTDAPFNFVFKLRYKLGIKIPIGNTIIEEKTYYIQSGLELFFDLTDDNVEQSNDRVRFDAGVGYRIKENLDIKVRYTLQQIFNNTSEDLFDFATGFSQIDHVVRITVSQTFGFDDED